jgi:hypothetical protein
MKFVRSAIPALLVSGLSTTRAVPWVRIPLSPPPHKYKANCPWLPGWPLGLEVSMIRSEIRSSAELKSRFFVSAAFTPTRYRAQTHSYRSPRARRRFGYWGEQIGHLRDQSGRRFGARRRDSILLPQVAYRQLPAVRSSRAIKRGKVRRSDGWTAPQSRSHRRYDDAFDRDVGVSPAAHRNDGSVHLMAAMARNKASKAFGRLHQAPSLCR